MTDPVAAVPPPDEPTEQLTHPAAAQPIPSIVTPEQVLDRAGAGADLSDAELLRAHVDGDPNAFAVLVTRHRDRLWAIALRTMRNPEDAADALQDAYIAAFRRAASFRGDAQVTTWLHRVVVNACLDRLRRNKVRAADPLPTDPDRSPELSAAVETTDPLEAQEQAADVAEALGRLNPDQRAALVLVDMEGYSVEEAATILGCAAGTVKSRCARGRAKLVPMLAHLRLLDPPTAAEPAGRSDRKGAGPPGPPPVGGRARTGPDVSGRDVGGRDVGGRVASATTGKQPSNRSARHRAGRPRMSVLLTHLVASVERALAGPRRRDTGRDAGYGLA